MARVYGDSTPFPHDIDYIQLVRDSIDCCVRLLSAEQSLRTARQRVEVADRARLEGAGELEQLFERVRAATGQELGGAHERTRRTAAQVVTGTRNVVDMAIAELDAQVGAELGQTRQIVDKAREASAAALEHFLERHAPPGSRLALSVLAGAEANTGHVTLVSPFGVSAMFAMALPPDHPWARPRRVLELCPNVEVHMPKESGWLSKRMEMVPVRLERSFISELAYGERSGVLRLRRAPNAGPGYQLRVDAEPALTAVICPIAEDGRIDDEHPLVLEGSEQAAMLGVWQTVVDSTRDLLGLRGRLMSGAFADRPLLELESPKAIADALIGYLAPTVLEISRRSGAPGELVLRRNLGEGRREETYSTHAELVEKMHVLPPELREVFAPLALSGYRDGPRVSAPPKLEPPPRPSEATRSAGPPPLLVADADESGAAAATGTSRAPSVPPEGGAPILRPA